MFLKEQDQIIARMGAEIAFLEQLVQKLNKDNEDLKQQLKEATAVPDDEPELFTKVKAANGKELKQ